MMEDGQWQVLDVSCAILEDQAGRVFAARRAAHLQLGGHWEFPGGKFEAGETALTCIQREMQEEFNVQVDGLRAGPIFVSELPGKRILRLHAVFCTTRQKDLRSTDHDQTLWLDLQDFPVLRWLPTDLLAIQWLQTRQSGVKDAAV